MSREWRERERKEGIFKAGRAVFKGEKIEVSSVNADRERKKEMGTAAAALGSSFALATASRHGQEVFTRVREWRNTIKQCHH